MKSSITLEKKSSLSQQKSNDHKNEFSYLDRTMPPEQAIVRENSIQINPEKFKEFISIQLDPRHAGFKENLEKFTRTMDKIRLAVQSNLGLSAIERDTHETYHPIWVKKGNPDFPVNENGQIPPEHVLYDAKDLGSSSSKNSPKILIVKDTSDNDGISFLFKTKFRCFSMHIASSGKVTSSLKLHWKAIYDDIAPITEGQQQALRSFTPWQRHSESNFFNGRSTNKILTYLTETFPSIFDINSTDYYKDSRSEYLDITRDNSQKTRTNGANLYLTLDHDVIQPPKEFKTDTRQPIFAIVQRKSPLMGNIIQLAPAVYADNKLHIVLHGHQNETTIKQIFHCNFEEGKLYDWNWQGKEVLLKAQTSKDEESPQWKSLHLLKYSKNRDLVKQTAAAPMVRGSDTVMRTFWLSGFDIPTVYSEMVTIADIFNIDHNSAAPLKRLEKLYYSDSASSSFRRLIFSEYELRQAKNLVIQLAIPHDSTDELFFWGKDGEHIGRTTRMALDVLLKLIPAEFQSKIRIGINMCCPASSVERLGAGFGLRNRPDNIERIIHSLKERYPHLFIEFKTLMLSNSDNFMSDSSTCREDKICETDSTDLNKISFAKNQSLSEMLNATGSDGLVWQSKPRNEEVYDMKTTLGITKASKVRPDFKFGYSGMVAALDDDTLHQLGYEEAGCPHSSVTAVVNEMKKLYDGNLPPHFEVMLGRVLLGSSWLLLGRYASDQEILLMTFLQGLLLREFAVGAGQAGIDLLQIHILYNLRQLSQEDLRNSLMAKVFELRSADKILDVLDEQCVSLNHATEFVKPSILKLKTTIDYASAGRYRFYSTPEKALIENQVTRMSKQKEHASLDIRESHLGRLYEGVRKT